MRNRQIRWHCGDCCPTEFYQQNFRRLRHQFLWGVRAVEWGEWLRYTAVYDSITTFSVLVIMLSASSAADILDKDPEEKDLGNRETRQSP